MEKELNDKKTDLIKKDPDELARETMFNQAQQKYESNVDDFRSGKIDQETFSKNNTKLSSFMSKVNSGADIGMKDLKDVGIKPTQELPMETKMSKSNKPYEVINTSEYGQQLKEVEASKIRVAEENLKKFDANGNPKVEAVANSPKTVDTQKVQSPDVDTPKPQVQHPKIDNFMTEAEAKTVGANKGFLSQRFDAVQDALNGPGSWKTKLGFAASALVLGSQSETFANTLNALDPTQLVMCQELGKGSDIVPPPNYQIQQAQSQLIPSIDQNQLNNIPTAMLN